MALIVGTWSFSKEAVEKASEIMKQGMTCIDAVERGISSIEDNENYGPCFVGRGGARNSSGDLELDAAIMEGKRLRFGAVTALKGVPRAISVARRVMEKSSHSMLTGDGALEFAKQEGFQFEPQLLSLDPHLQRSNPTGGHDTLGLIVVDQSGNVCTGVSTSGKSGKFPGRVGDSALPGCGLYADNTAGAACCSGDGDEILKFCPCFHVVQLMKQGHSPQESCDIVVKQILDRKSGETFEIGIIAANTKGDVGSSSTVTHYQDPITNQVYQGFPIVLWKDSLPTIKIVTSKTIKHSLD